jgi:hypothetical protein
MIGTLVVCCVAAWRVRNESYWREAPLMESPTSQIKPCANGHSLSRHRFAWCLFQGRQLQDGGVLTLAQLRDQDNFTIGKLKRVVMHGWLVWINLPKARELLLQTAAPEEAEQSIAFHVSFKRNFGPGQQANGYVGLANRGKAACWRSTKSGRN